MIKIKLLGTGGPVPFKHHGSPSILVEVGDSKLLVDCGPGTGIKLSSINVAHSDIDKILLTHFHMDHCHELPSLVFSSLLSGRDKPIHIYGPQGLKQLYNLFFDTAYPYLMPLAKMVNKTFPKIVLHEYENGVVFDEPGLSVVATQVKHGDTPSYGFRFEAGKSQLAISGDTVACPSLIELASGCHTLIQDCAFTDASAGNPFHATPKDVGVVASESGVKKVILVHLFPQCKGHEEEMVKSVKKNYAGEVEIGIDMMECII